jgi:hypothetical protein
VDNNWITKITAAKLRREMENEPLSTGILEVMGGACGVCEENYIYPDERCCFQFNVGAQQGATQWNIGSRNRRRCCYDLLTDEGWGQGTAYPTSQGRTYSSAVWCAFLLYVMRVRRRFAIETPVKPYPKSGIPSSSDFSTEKDVSTLLSIIQILKMTYDYVLEADKGYNTVQPTKEIILSPG